MHSLYRRCSRADNTDAFSLEARGVTRPPRGVPGLPLVILNPGNIGECGLVQNAHGCDQISAGILAAILVRQEPEPAAFLEFGRLNPRVKLHIAFEVEFLGKILDVLQRLGLRREMFSPVPFVEDFLRKRKYVRVTFRVKSRPWIAVPTVPVSNPVM